MHPPLLLLLLLLLTLAAYGNGDDCEASLGYQKFNSWYYNTSVSLCSSSSTSQIVCATKRKLFGIFCVGYNIIALDNVDKGWVAGCKLKMHPTELEHFASHLPSHSPLRNKMIKFVSNEEYAAIKNSKGVSKYKFTYVASGDCMTGNPGHCMADPHNFFIMANVLRAKAFPDISNDTTKVLVYSGFGANKFRTNSGNAPATIPFVEDWLPMASTIERTFEANVEHSILGISAQGFYGPHWRGFLDDPTCEGVSPVLLGARDTIIKFYNLHDRKDRQNIINNFITSQKNKINLLWILRSPMSNSRHISNIPEIIDKIKSLFPTINVQTTELGGFSYLEQYNIVSKADIVVSMHGSGLSNAARWMDSSQIMIEIFPQMSPGSTCPIAKMLGVPYYFTLCRNCKTTTRGNGNLDPLQITDIIQNIITNNNPYKQKPAFCREQFKKK